MDQIDVFKVLSMDQIDLLGFYLRITEILIVFYLLIK